MPNIQPFSATFVASPANVRHQIITFLLGKVFEEPRVLNEVVHVADDFESRLMPYAGSVPFFEIGLTNQTNSGLSDAQNAQKYDLGGDNLWVRFEPLTDRKDINECRQTENAQRHEAVSNRGLDQLENWRERMVAAAQLALTEAAGDPLSFGAALNSIHGILKQVDRESRLGQTIHKIKGTPEISRTENLPLLRTETQNVRVEIIRQLGNGALPPTMRTGLLATLNTLRDISFEKPIRLQTGVGTPQAAVEKPQAAGSPVAQRMKVIATPNSLSAPPLRRETAAGQTASFMPAPQSPSSPHTFLAKATETTLSIVRSASTVLLGPSVASAIIALSAVAAPPADNRTIQNAFPLQTNIGERSSALAEKRLNPRQDGSVFKESILSEIKPDPRNLLRPPVEDRGKPPVDDPKPHAAPPKEPSIVELFPVAAETMGCPKTGGKNCNCAAADKARVEVSTDDGLDLSALAGELTAGPDETSIGTAVRSDAVGIPSAASPHLAA